MIPGRWPIVWGQKYSVYIAVHSEDGTVAVSHGGTEMGQGIHTKVQIDKQIDRYIVL